MAGISFNGFVLLHGMDTENSWVHVLGFGLSFIYLFDLWIFFRTPGGWNGYGFRGFLIDLWVWNGFGFGGFWKLVIWSYCVWFVVMGWRFVFDWVVVVIVSAFEGFLVCSSTWGMGCRRGCVGLLLLVLLPCWRGCVDASEESRVLNIYIYIYIYKRIIFLYFNRVHCKIKSEMWGVL